MQVNKIANYQNGNTIVSILEDGTKIREYEGLPEIVYPESIDVKITNYCDMGCLYCHEMSTKKGIHADLNQLFDVLYELPPGIELAIGGGNPLSHPDLIKFLQRLKEKGIIANITVNQGHLKKYQDLLISLIKEELVKGIGISITSNNYIFIKKLIKITDNIVYHLIAGVNKIEIVDELIQLGKCKILVLGYKLFGFGINYYNHEILFELKKWHRNLHKLIGKCILSFDNLAIDQLKVKRLFTETGWNKFYMGDDFVFTMYIDAVKKQYAPTSRSNERKSFSEYSLLEFFKKYKNKPV